MSPLADILSSLRFTSQAGFYFRNLEHSLGDARMPLILTLLLITTCIVAFIAYSLYRKRVTQKTSLFKLVDPEEVAALLLRSVEERAKYDVQFEGGGDKRVQFACTPIKMDQTNGVILEASGFIQPHQNWIGRGVQCRFRVSSDRKDQRWQFFMFSSVITAIRRRGNLNYVVVRMPTHLERSQRRQHLRLEPPGGDIPVVKIWPETLTNVNQPGPNSPGLDYRHGRPNNPLNILNISAGGMVLEVRKKETFMNPESLERGKRLFVFLNLNEQEQDGENQEYMLRSQIRNSYTDPVTGNILLGLHFTDYLKPLGDESDQKKWVSLEGQGLDSIGDWVFKRHMELYRQKGIV